MKRVAVLLLLVVSAIALSQTPWTRTSMMSGFLVRNPIVEKELKLTAAQKTKINSILTSMRPTPMAPGKNGAPGPQDMRKQMDEMRKRSEDVNSKVLATLTSVQKTRLGQISLQFQGLGAAIMQPDVAKELGVTADQQKKLQTIQQAEGDQMRKMMPGPMGGTGGPKGPAEAQKRMEAFQKKMMALRKQTQSKMEAVLSKQQKQKWSQMIGKKVDLTMPARRMAAPGGGRDR